MIDPIELHRAHHGKIALALKTPITNREQLSAAYTPGVAQVSRAIAEDVERVWELTARKHWVAVVTDGSAVLGLGNIGPEAALPVMEGKAALFKAFADVDAFPVCLATQDPDAIVATVAALAPSFAGINLEDISAPRCFDIEKRLNDQLDIPVFHDDQHGTAIVVLAGLINACKVTRRTLAGSRVVISGAGAAGSTIARMLLSEGVSDVVVCDSHGILSSARPDLNEEKRLLQKATNPRNVSGTLAHALADADIFIGVSAPGLVTADMVRTMAPRPIVFALANPTPEIMPVDAAAGGAAVVATGRSDFPNQINNVLAFPGVFRGAMDCRAKEITPAMKRAAAVALAQIVSEPSAANIIPDPFDERVVPAVAAAVAAAWSASQK